MVIGIPQGSPISGTLANIYMLEIDKIIAEYIDNLNGYYIRYSDDFIIIIPNVNKEFNLIYDYLKQISNTKVQKQIGI